MVYGVYSISSNLIATCTYLLLRYLLSGRYGNLFTKVIMLSQRDLKGAYLHIVIKFHHFLNLFGKINLFSGGFCHIDWPQPLALLLPLLSPYFPLSMEGFLYYHIFG